MNCFESIKKTDEKELELRLLCLNRDQKILAELKNFPFIERYCFNLMQYWQFKNRDNEIYIHLSTRDESKNAGSFNITIAINKLKKEIKNLEILASEFIVKDDKNTPKSNNEDAQRARDKRIPILSSKVPQAIQQCLSPEAFKAARYLLEHWESLERKLTTD